MNFLSKSSNQFFIILNDSLEILEVIGQPGDVLEIPLGRLSANIYSLLNSEIAPELKKLLDLASSKNQELRSEILPYSKTNKSKQYIQIGVSAFKNESKRLQFAVQFSFFSQSDFSRIYEFKNRDNYDSESKLQIAILEADLDKTKNSLASYIEQLETTNNAILKSNEDLNFASSRYQSLNEQLEASNEELRVSNEELQNAYAEVSTLNKQLKINELELSRKEATLRAMVDNVPGVIFSAVFRENLDFHFTYISPKVESIFGININLAYEKGRHAFPVHPEDKEEWKDKLIHSIKTLSPWNHSARLLFEDGRLLYWEAHASVIKR
jgi:PAS domain-containing protein